MSRHPVLRHGIQLLNYREAMQLSLVKALLSIYYYLLSTPRGIVISTMERSTTRVAERSYHIAQRALVAISIAGLVTSILKMGGRKNAPQTQGGWTPLDQELLETPENTA